MIKYKYFSRSIYMPIKLVKQGFDNFAFLVKSDNFFDLTYLTQARIAIRVCYSITFLKLHLQDMHAKLASFP